MFISFFSSPGPLFQVDPLLGILRKEPSRSRAGLLDACDGAGGLRGLGSRKSRLGITWRLFDLFSHHGLTIGTVRMREQSAESLVRSTGSECAWRMLHAPSCGVETGVWAEFLRAATRHHQADLGEPAVLAHFIRPHPAEGALHSRAGWFARGFGTGRCCSSWGRVRQRAKSMMSLPMLCALALTGPRPGRGEGVQGTVGSVN